MELQEIKATWTELNTELNEYKILNEKRALEMALTKKDNALSNLTNYEIGESIVILILIPLIIYVVNEFSWTNIQQINLYLIVAVLTTVIFLQFRKLHLLYQVNFAKSISWNIVCIEKYKLQVGREKIANLIAIPLIAPLILETQRVFASGLELWRWVAIGILLIILVIISIWLYKKFYSSNIKQIRESLDKLNDAQDSY